MIQKRKSPRVLRRRFEPWMIDAAIKHVDEGYSLGSFAGKYEIPEPLWRDWVRENEALSELNKLYKEKIIAHKKSKVWR